MLSSDLVGALPTEFIQDWYDSVSRVIGLFETEQVSDNTNQVLVNSFASLRPSFLVTDARSLRICFGNQLDLLQSCLGMDNPYGFEQAINRARGSGITLDNTFWNEFAAFVDGNPMKRRRLLQHLSVDSEDGMDQDEIIGFERLQSMSIELRDYQNEMIQALCDEIERAEMNVVVKLPTGAGKTRVALESMFILYEANKIRTVLWIADDKNLCQQAVDSCRRYYYNGNAKRFDLILVSFFDGMAKTDLSTIELEENESLFIVATPDQLSPNLALMPQLDVFVMDEAHTSIEERWHLFQQTNARVLIGLSATPPTFWQGDTSLLTPRTSFDATLETTNQFLERTGVLSRQEIVEFRPIDLLDEEQLESLFSENDVDFKHPFVLHSILSRLVEDIEMNLLRSAIVYVDRVEQAIVLSNLLNQIIDIPNSSVIHGKMGFQQRRNIIRKFRDGEIKILFNVRLLSEGFDAPNIDNVYFCQITNPLPGSQRFIQRVGRGLRGIQSGGTKTCRITIMNFDHE